MKRGLFIALVALFLLIVGSVVEAQTMTGPPKTKLGIPLGIKIFEVNYNDSITTSQSVTLYNTLVNAGAATHYRASENASFGGASWIVYSGSPAFSLSSGDGQKTVYFQVKNSSGTSTVASDSITYQRLPAVTAFKINNDAASTSTLSVTLTNTTTGVVTHYRMCEDASFGGASWIAYCGSTSLTLSGGAGQKTVYFQTKNENGSSNTASDTITYAPPLATQVLDYQKAKLAGATFVSGSDNPLPGVSGQCDWNNCDVTSAQQAQPGVFFFAYMSSTLMGSKATPEAYGNFSLKNGWQIKEISLVEILKTSGDWQWVSGPPSIGSTNPYVKIHIWAEPAVGFVRLGLRIVIEGPDGTDPYQ